MSASTPRWLRMLLADRKKLGMMVALLAVALLLWGRLLLKRVPQVAVADPNAVVAIDVDGNVIAEKDKDDKKLDPKAFERKVVIVEIPSFITRDIFAPGGRFTQATDETGNDTSQEKSVDDSADREMQRRLAVRAAAMQLTLRTTVEGDKPLALINDKLVAPGEPINGFTLIRVGGRWVLLEMNGIYVRLEM